VPAHSPSGRRPAYGYRYQKLRARLLAEDPDCAHGCGRPATEADHQPPLSRHVHVESSGCCVLVPSCLWCRKLQAAALSGARPPQPGAVVEPEGFDVDDPVWDVPWLEELRDVPENAWWPRLMTVPHPRAVGSIGLEFVGWVRVELGVVLRWWQVLFAVRLLEVDEEGRLVWTAALLTLARQCGKSLLVYCLAEWRSEQAARFGELQLVLHTADTLEHAKAVWNMAQRRALERGYGLRRAAGEYAISKPDGDWLVRSQAATVGYSASFAVADECHQVKVETIEQKLGATTIEKAESQLLLVSTASSTCTELFPMRRAGALARLGDPDDELLVEWSAPRGASVLDEVAWRQASPWWHPRRANDIRGHAERAAPYESQPHPHELVVGVRTQWCNEWPPPGVLGAKGAVLITAERWAGARCDVDSVGPRVIAVEDHYGQGAAIGFCGRLPDDRLVVGGQLCDSRADAYALATLAGLQRPGSSLVVGASLAGDPALEEIPVVAVSKAGTTETPPALTMLRDMVAVGRVVHDGSLDHQMAEVRVKDGQGGLTLVVGPRSDLLRAAVWALYLTVTDPAPAPAIH
jgi:hypothetical protein